VATWTQWIKLICSNP